MAVRGIRGAHRARSNTRKSIFETATRLMRAMLRTNRVKPAQVAACIFTMTPDLNADFPAYAARRAAPGWKHVPMLCAGELPVPGAMDRVVRILLLVETDAAQGKIQHQYLGGTARLRPDLARKKERKRRRK